METTFITSEKGKSLLLINGYKFSLQKTLANGAKRWTCSSKKTLCKAFVKTIGEDNTVISSTLEHNHNKLLDHLLNRQILSNSVKKSALENPTEKARNLIRQELQKTDLETITKHDVKRARINACNARTSVLANLRISGVEEFHRPLDEKEFDELDPSIAAIDRKKGQEYYRADEDKVLKVSCPAIIKPSRKVSSTVFSGFQNCEQDTFDLAGDSSCSASASYISIDEETKLEAIMEAEPDNSVEQKNIYKGMRIKEEPDVAIDDDDVDMEDTKFEERCVDVTINTFDRDTTITYCKEEPDEQAFKSIADLKHNMCEEESFATKDERIENSELDIKEEFSNSDDIHLVGNDIDDLLVSRGRLKTEEHISQGLQENALIINEQINSKCSIEASSQNGSFAFCNDCCKAFYRGFSFDKMPNGANWRTNIWKCSKQSCQVEVTIFFHTGCFMEIGEHNCTSHVVKQQHHDSSKMLLIEEQCSTAFRGQRILTRYRPLKKVIEFLNVNQIADEVPKMDDADQADPTAIMYYSNEKKKKIALYMGLEHTIHRASCRQMQLVCKNKSCPGKWQVLRPDKAIALIHNHNCKIRTIERQTVAKSLVPMNSNSEDKNDLENYTFVNVFDNRLLRDTYEVQKRAGLVPVVDPKDPSILMFFYNEAHETLVIYMGRQYLAHFVNNSTKNEWKCRHFQICPALLKMTENSRAVMRIADHSCEFEELSAEVIPDKYMPVKLVSYLHLGSMFVGVPFYFPEMLLSDDFCMPVFYHNNDEDRDEVYYMGYEYLKQNSKGHLWTCTQFPSCRAKFNSSKDRRYTVRTDNHRCEKLNYTCSDNSESTYVAHASLKRGGRYTGSHLNMNVSMKQWTVPKVSSKDSSIVLYYLNHRKEEIAYYMGYDYVFFCSVKEYTEWICKDKCSAIIRVSSNERMAARYVHHHCRKNTKTSNEIVDLFKPSALQSDNMNKLFLPVEVIFLEEQLYKTVPPCVSEYTIAYFYKFISDSHKYVALYNGHQYLPTGWNTRYYTWNCEHLSCRASLLIQGNKRALTPLINNQTRGKQRALTLGFHTCQQQTQSPLFNNQTRGKKRALTLGLDTCQQQPQTPLINNQTRGKKRAPTLGLDTCQQQPQTPLINNQTRGKKRAVTLGLDTCQQQPQTPLINNQTQGDKQARTLGIDTCQQKTQTPLVNNQTRTILVCGQTSDSVNVKKIIEENYTPVKILNYMDHKIYNYEVESKLGTLPQIDPGDCGTAVYFFKNIGWVRRKAVLYMGYIYTCRQNSRFYIFYNCLNSSCPATVRIQKSEKGILVVGKHTCNKTKDLTVTKSLVADTSNRDVMHNNSIDVRQEINEKTDIQTNDIGKTKNNLTNNPAVSSNESKSMRNVIVLNYSTDPQPVASTEQYNFQILASTERFYTLMGESIEFRGYKHVIKRESRNHTGYAGRHSCIHIQKYNCEGAVLLDTHQVVGFVKHTCDKLNQSIPYLDPNDDTTMLLYNTGLEKKVRLKYHGFNYHLISRQEQFSMWQCAEGGQCAAKLQFFFFAKRICLIGEHMELMTQNKSLFGDVELKDYCFRVFPKINDHRLIRVFNERLQPHLIYKRFLYNLGQANTDWQCIHKDSYNCSGGISLTEGNASLSLKHTCLPESRKEKLLRIFRGQSSKYVFYQSYVFQKKNEFRGKEVVFTWQCMTDDCEKDLTTVNGKVMSDAMHTCGKQVAPPISFKAKGMHYLFNEGYLHQAKSKNEKYWSCVHKEAFDCQGNLQFILQTFFMPQPGHSCFERSRSADNLMVFQQNHTIYGYFKGYLYKRSFLLYHLHEVYKWNCMMPRCTGILTTKFGKVAAESIHTCRISEGFQIKAEELIEIVPFQSTAEGSSETESETDCLVLSDDSVPAENKAKKLKVEEHLDDRSQCIEMDEQLHYFKL